jgi:hypothetical protein
MEVLNNPEDRGERGSDPGLVEKITPRLDRTGTASWSRSSAGSKREPLERPGNAKLRRLRHRNVGFGGREKVQPLRPTFSGGGHLTVELPAQSVHRTCSGRVAGVNCLTGFHEN